MQRLFRLASVSITIVLLSSGCTKASRSVAGIGSEARITGASTDPAVELPLRWEPGGRYVMRMESKQTSESRRGSGQGPGIQETTIAHEYAVSVTNAPAPGERGLDVELLSVEIDQTMGNRNSFTYDSQNRVIGTGGEPGAEAISRLIGAHVQYLLDSSNTVIAENGLADLISRGAARTNAPANGKRPGRSGWIGGIVANQAAMLESFKQMLALSALPQRPYRVGDAWPVKFELNAGTRTMTVSGTNTFRGWQEHERKNCARIDLLGSITSRKRAASAQAEDRPNRGGMMGGDGTIVGTCWFDPAARFPTEVAFENSFTRTASQTDRPSTNALQAFTAQSRQSFSFKLIDIALASAK